MPSYPVIYAFGDSLSDAGDAYLLTSSTYAATLGLSAEPVHPPYYQETYGATVADVFSNGPVWIQDLATTLGITAPAPADLGARADTLTAALVASGLSSGQAQATVGALETSQGTLFQSNPYISLVSGAAGGTDFAIGGSVTGVTPENSGATVPLTDLQAQLTNFQHEVTTPVAGALYTVWSGSNDLLNLLEDANFATLSTGTIATDVADSVAAEVAMVSSLVTGGAQNVLVMNVPDLGHIPALTAGSFASEAAEATTLSSSFDTQLAADLASANFGTAQVKLGDDFSLINAAIASPATYGLTNVTQPVYTGDYDTDNGTIVSTDPAVQNTYLFFDEQHPTSGGHTQLAALADQVLTACYAQGTRIATPDGHCAVERLRAGDLVLTLAGPAVPVTWVGHRHVAMAGHPRPWDVQPVRIRKDAFAPGRPVRDLVLSPDHAVFADGVLIPVRHLLNGASVVQEAVARVTYWHVELAAHDVLLAEGLPAESYLDTGNRAAFANGGTVAMAHPDFARGVWQAAACAELRESGPDVEAVRAALRARLPALGFAVSEDAALCVASDGVAIEAQPYDGWLVYALPDGARTLDVRSRSASPAALAASDDWRRLGVAVSGVRLDGVEMALDDRRLGRGWHHPERALRWTDGAGTIDVTGAAIVELRLLPGLVRYAVAA